MSTAADDPSDAQILAMLRIAQAIAQRALDAGHHPFGAALFAPDHVTVLAEHGNLSSVEHAESELLRDVVRRHTPDELWPCTLVTTVEPCAMCAGTQYWAHVGRVVYGMPEHDLLALTGAHPENATLDLPCREVFARGQKPVRVIGPVEAMRDEIASLHRRFWSAR